MLNLKKILFFFSLALSFSSSLYGLNLDSLWRVWEDTSQHDTIRMRAIGDLSFDGYLFNDPDSAFILAEMLKKFAQKKGYRKRVAIAYNTQGASYYFKGDFISSIACYDTCLKIMIELGDKKDISGAYNNIGIIYENQGDHIKAIENYELALNISLDQKDSIGISSAYQNIGVIYMAQGNIPKAMGLYMKAIEIDEALGIQTQLPTIYHNLGILFFQLADTAQSLKNHKKSFDISKEIGNKLMQSVAANSIGKLYFDAKDLNKAKTFFDRSLELAIQLDYKLGIANVYLSFGEIYNLTGETDKALLEFNKALDIYKEVGKKEELTKTYILFGRVYLKKGQTSEAEKYGERALTMSRELNTPSLVSNAAELLCLVNKKKGKYQKAFEFHELFISKRDIVKNEENKKTSYKKQIQFEFDKEKALKEVGHQAEIKEHKATTRFTIFITAILIIVSIIITSLIYRNNRAKKKIIGVINETNSRLEEKNENINSSINYARKIQDAILPKKEALEEIFAESFIFYKPRDIVSGDFYWVHKKDNGLVFFTVADCTGHGVPGAFMSMIGHSLLNEFVVNRDLSQADVILDNMRIQIKKALGQKGKVGEARDGMDMALCILDKATGKLEFSGAHNSLYVVRNNELIEYKGSKRPVGYYLGLNIPFEKETVEVKKGDMLYIFSDGFADQFGGPKGKKFMYGKFKKLLVSVSGNNMNEQKAILNKNLLEWMSEEDQIDDICIMGVRV